MMWEILGISPTKDIKAIKTAYARLAKQFNPEEHPEEFKRIFDAYKAACAYARSHEENGSCSDDLNKNAAADVIHEKSKDIFDFGNIGRIAELTPQQRSEKLLKIMKEWVSDPIQKNNYRMWKLLFADGNFEELIFDTGFRKKAAGIFRNVTFSPEAASAIASGFGKGSKAVNAEKKSDFWEDLSSPEDVQAFSFGDDKEASVQKWKVLISDGTGKPVKTKSILPGYARSENGVHMRVKDVIICIIIAAVLIIGAGIYGRRNEDASMPGNIHSEEKSAETFTIGNSEFYFDENGELKKID